MPGESLIVDQEPFAIAWHAKEFEPFAAGCVKFGSARWIACEKDEKRIAARGLADSGDECRPIPDAQV